MNILDVSIQLRELSNGYSTQRVAFEEYRLKRKLLLDEIDQTLNQQSRQTILQDAEIDEPNDKNDVMPKTINLEFDTNKKSDDTGARD